MKVLIEYENVMKLWILWRYVGWLEQWRWIGWKIVNNTLVYVLHCSTSNCSRNRVSYPISSEVYEDDLRRTCKRGDSIYIYICFVFICMYLDVFMWHWCFHVLILFIGILIPRHWTCLIYWCFHVIMFMNFISINSSYWMYLSV